VEENAPKCFQPGQVLPLSCEASMGRRVPCTYMRLYVRKEYKLIYFTSSVEVGPCDTRAAEVPSRAACQMVHTTVASGVKMVILGTPARSNLCRFSAQIFLLSTRDSPDRDRFGLKCDLAGVPSQTSPAPPSRNQFRV
jgi:hypothetical protein